MPDGLNHAKRLAVIIILMCGTITMERVAEASVFDEIQLLDVQGLFGGQNVYLQKDGRFCIQIVRNQNGLKEKRYQGRIGPDEVAKMMNRLGGVRLESIVIKDRPGVPDEARPVIILIKGAKVTVKSMWASDFNPDFNHFYSPLLHFAKDHSNQPPTYTGAYQVDYLPDGFTRAVLGE